MPLTLACPSCSSRITAPDRLAGKTVRCPKCQTQFQIPPAPAVVSDFEVVADDEPVIAVPRKPGPAADAGFEVVEDDEPVLALPKVKEPPADAGFEVFEDDEPVVAPVRPKSRPRIEKEEDEDNGDLNYRPLKRKKVKKAFTPKWLFPAVGGGAFLVAATVGIFFLVTDKRGEGNSGSDQSGTLPGIYIPPPMPNGWVRFSDPDGRFIATLPGVANKVTSVGPRTGRTTDLWRYQTTDGQVFVVAAQGLPADAPSGLASDRDLDRICDGIGATIGFGQESGRSKKTLSGLVGREVTFQTAGVTATLRLVVWNKTLFMVVAAGPVSEVDKEALFAQYVIKR